MIAKLLSTAAASAALTAFIVLPARFEVTVTVFLAAGLGLVLAHDYRTPRMLQLPARRPVRWRPAFRAPALRVPAEAHRLAA